MAIKLDDLDALLGYEPETHSLKGLPSLAKPSALQPSPKELASPPTRIPSVNPPATPNTAPNTMPEVMPTAGTASPTAGIPAIDTGTSQPQKPQQSFWQKLGHGLEKGAETAGNVLVPNVMADIPGTQLNKEVQAGRQWKRLGEQADIGLKQEQAKDLAQGNQPTAWTPTGSNTSMMVPFKNIPELEASREREQAAQTGETERLTEQEQRETEREKAAGERQTQGETFSAQAQGEREAATEKGREESEAAAERRLEQTIAGENARLMMTLKQKGDTSPFMHGLATNAAKDVATANGADFRFRSMNDSYPRALKGDQQAMLNLLANHIGMTMGLQKGARITKDILQEAQHSTPWLARIGAKFDDRGYLSGLTLTPEQMGQMMDLAKSQRVDAWQQVRDSAEQAGVGNEVKYPDDLKGGGGGNEPPRPANVPEGYQFNANGPKGAGWYRPKPK